MMRRPKRLVEWALSFALVVTIATPTAAADPTPVVSKKRSKAAPKKPLPNAKKKPQKPKAAPESEPEELSMRDLPPAASPRAAEPAIVASPPVVERDTGASAPAPTRARRIGRELVSLEGGVGAGMRHFSYNERRTTTLSPYHLDGSPVFSLAGELYPFPLDGVVDVGVAGGYTSAIGVSSAGASAEGGPTVSTSWWHFRVGPRARFRFGANDSTVLGASVSYGGESFHIDQDPAARTVLLPEVAYRFIRPSLDARLTYGRVSPFAQIGYSAILSAGAVTDRFPNASVGGVDAELGVGYRVVEHFELRATVTYRRYFYALHPQPGDAYVAGGALDEMGDGKLALAWFM